MSQEPPTQRTHVRRHPERAIYDRAEIHAILDEALVAHVGYVVDGQPRVIPTLHVRVGGTLYLHGSPASSTLRALKGTLDVCVECTVVDGLVLARSAFKHSINYRSVVIYGVAEEVVQPSEKLAALDALIEHVIPGRLSSIRRPDDRELAQTAVIAIPLHESSAKVREGGPVDLERDSFQSAWAGVVPLRLGADEPVPAPDLPSDAPVPEHVRNYRRGGGQV